MLKVRTSGLRGSWTVRGAPGRSAAEMLESRAALWCPELEARLKATS